MQSKLRAAAAADEKLKEAQTFLDEHLRYFHARRKSQLKVVAIPVLAEAISRARVAMVLPERVKEAENKLDEAKLVQGRAEEAAQELTAAVTSAVKALERASADPEQAQETERRYRDAPGRSRGRRRLWRRWRRHCECGAAAADPAPERTPREQGSQFQFAARACYLIRPTF